MGVNDPHAVIGEWVRLFNAGDLEGLVADMYEDGAVLVPGPDAAPVSGKDAVREVIEQFLAMKGTMSIAGSSCTVSGDLALCHDHWRLEGAGGSAEGTTADVVRRQADGTWKYVIDNPFGSEILTDS
jgi:ketosteroid isomerase-like protein